MHLTECYKYVNGKLKNGAAGNSHKGQAAQRPCLASPKHTENCPVQQPAFQSYTTKGGEKGVKMKLSFSLTSDLLEWSYKQAKCRITCSRVGSLGIPVWTMGMDVVPAPATTSRTSKRRQSCCSTSATHLALNTLQAAAEQQGVYKETKKGLKEKLHFPVTEIWRCQSLLWSSLLRVEAALW